MLKRAILNNKIINGYYHDENQYLNLIKDVLNYGESNISRNGRVKSIYGSAMHFNLSNNIMPIITTKKLAWKTCLKELFWFINGSTNNKLLKNQKVNIWNGNSSREFLDSRKLYNNKEDDLGPIYGHQWRHFNAEYINCDKDYTGKGVDQLKYIIDNLQHNENKYSRRLVMSAWNPCQLDQMALPPCHVLVQFNVSKNNKLSCSLYQRSGDIGLGVPFNIASYSFLTHLIAKHCNLDASEFIYHLGNCHIYSDHIDILEKQIENKPKLFPTIKILNKKDNIEDYNLKDIDIKNYNFNKKLNMKMRC
jgi:thymidylate synthase